MGTQGTQGNPWELTETHGNSREQNNPTKGTKYSNKRDKIFQQKGQNIPTKGTKYSTKGKKNPKLRSARERLISPVLNTNCVTK